MKGTIALIIVIFQSLLFWMAWTGDSVRHDKQLETLNADIERVENRCDSLCVVLNTIEQIKGDTIIINTPKPIVKVINK
jgi:hypothetical protein